MKWFAGFLLTIACLGAQADGWVVFPSISYERTVNKDQADEVSRSHFYLDVRVLHRWESGFAAGAVLSGTTGVGNSSYSFTQTGIGPSVAYLKNGWVGAISYLPIVSQEEKLNSNTTKWGGGSSFHLDGGYLFTVAPTVLIGPTLNFRHVSFTSIKVNAQDEAGYTLRREDWRPMVSSIILL